MSEEVSEESVNDRTHSKKPKRESAAPAEHTERTPPAAHDSTGQKMDSENIDMIRYHARRKRLERLKPRIFLIMLLFSLPFILLLMAFVARTYLWVNIFWTMICAVWSLFIYSLWIYGIIYFSRQAHSCYQLSRGTKTGKYRIGLVFSGAAAYILLVPFVLGILLNLSNVPIIREYYAPGEWTENAWNAFCLWNLPVLIILAALAWTRSYRELDVRKLRVQNNILPIVIAAESEITGAMDGYSTRPFSSKATDLDFNRDRIVLFGHFLKIHRQINRIDTRHSADGVIFKADGDISFTENMPHNNLLFWIGEMFYGKRKMHILMQPGRAIQVNMDRKFYEGLGYEASYHELCDIIARKVKESYERFCEGDELGALKVFSPKLRHKKEGWVRMFGEDEKSNEDGE